MKMNKSKIITISKFLKKQSEIVNTLASPLNESLQQGLVPINHYNKA